MRLLHGGELLRYFRHSASVTYVSTLPSASVSVPCISPPCNVSADLQANRREWALRATFSIYQRLLSHKTTAALYYIPTITETIYSLSYNRNEFLQYSELQHINSSKSSTLSGCMEQIPASKNKLKFNNYTM